MRWEKGIQGGSVLCIIGIDGVQRHINLTCISRLVEALRENELLLEAVQRNASNSVKKEKLPLANNVKAVAWK